MRFIREKQSIIIIKISLQKYINLNTAWQIGSYFSLAVIKLGGWLSWF